MPFPFQESLSLAEHLLAVGVSLFFAVSASCVASGSVFALVVKFHGSESMDPRWSDLALRCARLTRALAVWAACPLGLGLWVILMAQQPRMMEQLHLIFIVPALLGLSFFSLALWFLHRYIASWGRAHHESRLHSLWGLLSAVGFWCAAAILVSICAFSAHTGAWIERPGLSNAFWNPTFPAAFVTWAAVSISIFGAFGMLYAVMQKDRLWRVALVHELGKWMAWASIAGLLGWIWWGIRLPESANHKLVLSLLAAAVSGEAVLGVIAYRWGVRDPERRQRLHAGVASVLVVLLVATFGWVYAEAKGNFQIHRYMYRNGIIIEEAESSHQSGLWRIAYPGKPLPTNERLGAFSFRAQCMACHADWVKSKSPSRTPGFRFERDALRFLEEIGSQHPRYPVFAGTPEERRALAAYIEALITKSGRVLASRPEPPRIVEQKPKSRPDVVSGTPPGDREKGAEISKSGVPEAGEDGGGATASPASPKAMQGANKAEEEGSVSTTPSSPPDGGQEAKSSQEAGISEEKESAFATSPGSSPAAQDAKKPQDIKASEKEGNGVTAPSAPSSDAPDAGGSQEAKISDSEEKESVSTAPSNPPDDGRDAKSSQEAGISEEKESAFTTSPDPSNDAPDAKKPQDIKASGKEGSGVTAPSSPPNDLQGALKPEEKNSP